MLHLHLHPLQLSSSAAASAFAFVALLKQERLDLSRPKGTKAWHDPSPVISQTHHAPYVLAFFETVGF